MTFLVISYFAGNPITVVLDILEGRKHGPSPPKIFGDRPPAVHPKSPTVCDTQMGDGKIDWQIICHFIQFKELFPTVYSTAVK